MDHIKIKNIKPKIQYLADGNTTTYNFPFSIFKPENISIYFGNQEQTNNYTVSINQDTDGGSVVFDAAPENGVIITILRRVNIERTSDFQAGGSIRAEEINYEFDYQVACTQQIADDVSRSMTLPPYFVDKDIDLSIPKPEGGRAIVWSQDGKKLENSTININSIASEVENKKQIAIEQAQIATEQAGIAAENKSLTETFKNECATIVNHLHPENLAEKDFCNTGFLTNCILEAPNGVATFSGNTITLKAGLKVLIPNGRDEDGRLRNIVYTLQEDITQTVGTGNSCNRRYLCLRANGQIYASRWIAICSEIPYLNFSIDETYLNQSENKIYHHSPNETEWIEDTNPFCILGYYTSNAGVITSLTEFRPTRVGNQNEIAGLYAYKNYENANSVATNLNFYTHPGVYSFESFGVVSNVPKGVSGLLLVIGNLSTLKQIWFPGAADDSYENEIYVRTYTHLLSTWSDWKRVSGS